METKIKEIVDEPTYNAEATAASKATIFIFLGTTIFKIFTTNGPGFVGGLLFFFLGMFVVSLLIAAPFFYLQKRFSNIQGIFDIISAVATLYLTHLAYEYFFT